MAALGRVIVPLDEQEIEALVQMAEADCRQPREQLRYLLRREARHRGFFSEPAASHEHADKQPQSGKEDKAE